jgi:hypothetical protein
MDILILTFGLIGIFAAIVYTFTSADKKIIQLQQEQLKTSYRLITLIYYGRPIDSAPKNGTKYLGAIQQPDGSFGEPFICYWDGEEHVCEYQTEMKPHKPTHWMPLPEPPTQEDNKSLDFIFGDVQEQLNNLSIKNGKE